MSANALVETIKNFIAIKFRSRYPFATKNPLGFLVAATIQYIMLLNVWFFVACLISTGIGCFFFVLTMVDDAKVCLRSINKSAKAVAIPSILLKKYLRFIQLHSNTKQLRSKQIWQSMHFLGFPLSISRFVFVELSWIFLKHSNQMPWLLFHAMCFHCAVQCFWFTSNLFSICVRCLLKSIYHFRIYLSATSGWMQHCRNMLDISSCTMGNHGTVH